MTTEIKLWIVMDGDYDGSWVVAVYPNSELAEAHVAEMGGWIDEESIRNSLHPDVTDPAKRQERADATQRAVAEYESYRRHQEEQHRAWEKVRPRKGHMRLCKCQTWPGWTTKHINAHGYCRYCGGFTIGVFREVEGDAALHRAIDELALYDRERMRALA